jgi:hypothetical protein
MGAAAGVVGPARTPLRAPASALLLLGVALFGAGGARAAPASVVGQAYRSSVSLTPGITHVGEPVRYRGRVVVPRTVQVRWVPPASDGALEWSAPVARRRHAFSGNQFRNDDTADDTAEVEAVLQVFSTGMVSVPGLAFRVGDPSGRWRESRLPLARLALVPVVSPDDTSASLRPLRGPLGAPWWERVPWRIVAAAGMVLALAAFAVARLRRRRPAAAVEPVRVRPARDPASTVLEELEALRGRNLPEQGRFAEHAYLLTRILRRFLEATQGAPRPGDTTPELVAHLGTTRLAPPQIDRLAALLSAWDRVKFARAASTPEEAHRAEDAVAGLARERLAGGSGGGP